MRYVIKKSCDLTSNSTTLQDASVPVVYEEVSPESQTKRRNDFELKENVAYGPIATV